MSSTASANAPARPRVWIPSAWWIVAGAVFVVAWKVVGVDLHALFSAQAAADAWRFVGGLFPPDLSPAFLRTVFRAAAQTLATAIAATMLSIAIGMPLAVLASGHLWRRGVLVDAPGHSRGSAVIAGASHVARAMLGFVRAVPDILWAILFVTMFGLGTLPGTLALAVAYSGLIGQVFSNVFDAA